MALFRLLKIIFVALHYRLDELVLQHAKLLWLKRLLGYALRWRKQQRSRGENLRLALESLGPIFVKFGQMLSTRRDLLPLDIADELAKLQDQVPPFAYDEVEKILIAAYQQPINQVFSEFSPQPVASASVAQVHFAKLLNGQEVAVKILRPNIRQVIEKDIALLDTAAWLMLKFLADGERLRPREVVEEFAKHLDQELDLLLEAANATRLKNNFADSQQLLIPEIYWDYCHAQVMVMQRMSGIPVAQIDRLKAAGINLSKLAKDGVDIFFTQVFRDGYFHADMHPGNLFVDRQGRLCAVDFGIMGRLGLKERRFLAEILYGFITRDYLRVAEVHFEAGYVPSHHRVEDFAQAVRAIGEPIHSRTADQISMAKLLTLLFEITALFDMHTRTELVMLQKTMVVVEGVARKLDPHLDMWSTADPVVRSWIEENLGPIGKLSDVGRVASKFGRAALALPEMLDRAERLTQKLEDATKHGFALSPASVEAIGKAEARRARWGNAALWVIAALLAWLVLIISL